MKLRLTDYQDNTYEDTDGSCDLCMWTGMMDHPTYEFTDSYDGVHTVDGWECDWGHMRVYDINLPVFTTWLHNAEFKEPEEIDELPGYGSLSYIRFWEKFLGDIIRSAEFRSNEEALNEALDWALKGEADDDD